MQIETQTRKFLRSTANQTRLPNFQLLIVNCHLSIPLTYFMLPTAGTREMMTNMESLRIGNGCGFWGDNLDAPILLAQHGELHYLTLEYLAELTMSILALQTQRDEEAGYASDFLDVLERLCPILQNKSRLKIITNAGGMNPQACARKARDILGNAGVFKRIAVVEGDD